jgi:hypothetical protein
MEYCQLLMEWALNHAPSSVNAATDTTIVDRFAAGQTNRYRDQHSERGQQEPDLLPRQLRCADSQDDHADAVDGQRLRHPTGHREHGERDSAENEEGDRRQHHLGSVSKFVTRYFLAKSHRTFQPRRSMSCHPVRLPVRAATDPHIRAAPAGQPVDKRAPASGHGHPR